MADHKVRQYTQRQYSTSSRSDPKVRFYEPKHANKEARDRARTYDTSPERYPKARTYHAKPYRPHPEYVPPWSRGKERAGRPRQAAAKPKAQSTVKPVFKPVKVKDARVTFAAKPVVITEISPLPATGSIRRTMELFQI